MKLFAFADKDMCPVICTDTGAFKKSQKTPEQVKEEERDAKCAEELAKKEENKIVPLQELGKREDHAIANLPKPEKQCSLQLKPTANGKFDWSLLASLTGARPRVTKYALSRYSPDEWRKHNAGILNNESLVKANILEYNGNVIIKAAYSNVDKIQLDNTNRLKQRAKEIFRWQVEIELACRAMAKEVGLLELVRQRIKNAFRVLLLPESISKECIELRSSRAETDLVMDTAEQELLKEMTLISEVRETFRHTLQKVEEQLASNRAAKSRVEYDWCDKTIAYKTEILNLSLSIKSDIIMFRPGATKFSTATASQPYWEYFCRKNIKDVEAVRQISADLRRTVNDTLMINGTKLKEQADKTDSALAETVAFTSEMLTKIQEHFRKTLQSLAEIELSILSLHNTIRKMDSAMKLAQTRLDNRNTSRPHQENVRDQPHVGLLQEVKVIHENVASLLAQLNKAEQNRRSLMEKRRDIEMDIASKKKTLNIDRERCRMIRSHYPTALEIAGL